MQKRTVLITGAAGVLGQAVAKAFRSENANLALLDVNADALQKLFGTDNEKQMVSAIDLKDIDGLISAVDAIVGKFRRIDAVCNIAGGFRMGEAVHETTDETWHHMFSLNTWSVINMSRAVVPHMLRSRAGNIVNVAAMAALKGAAQMGAYSVSKSAVVRLTETMAGELGNKGIRVNCVLPSTMDTPTNRADMPDVDPASWVSPDAVAEVIAFLASDRARGVNGAAIPIEANTLQS